MVEGRLAQASARRGVRSKVALQHQLKHHQHQPLAEGKQNIGNKKNIYVSSQKNLFGRVCDTRPIRHMEVSLSQALHELFSGAPAHLPIHQGLSNLRRTHSDRVPNGSHLFGPEQRSALRSTRFVV